MLKHPRVVVCRRLHRMLFVGIAMTGCGLLLLGVSMKGAFVYGPWFIGGGTLGLLLGAGVIGAAWLGYVFEGAWRFRLRTLMATTTIIAVLFAAWPAWIGPTFFRDTNVKWQDRCLIIETGAIDISNFAGGNDIGFMVLTIPILGPGPCLLLLFPLIFLPFILRHRGERIADQGDEISDISS